MKRTSSLRSTTCPAVSSQLVSQEQSWASHFSDMIIKASSSLDISLVDDSVMPASRFEQLQPSQMQVPLLPDFKDLISQQFGSSAELHKWSVTCRRFSNIHVKGKNCLCPSPPGRSGSCSVSLTLQLPFRHGRMLQQQLQGHGCLANQATQGNG